MNLGNLRRLILKMNNSTEKDFFYQEMVGNSGKRPIELRLETLIANKRELPWEWYKALGIDKSDASKIRRGVIIPSREWRIKIAIHFGVDSCTIWTPIDILGMGVGK